MDIFYTTKAKNDLAKIDWRIREEIINEIGFLSDEKEARKELKPIGKNPIIKYKAGDYIVLGRAENNCLNVLKIIKKKEIKLPE